MGNHFPTNYREILYAIVNSLWFSQFPEVTTFLNMNDLGWPVAYIRVISTYPHRFIIIGKIRI